MSNKGIIFVLMPMRGLVVLRNEWPGPIDSGR
jgi:hypothetical protein